MNGLFEFPVPKGHIKATVIRANGKKFIHCDAENTIQTGLKNYLAGALQTNSTESLDNLFASCSDTPTNGKDGIARAGTWGPPTDDYMFKCTGTGVGSETLGWSGTGASRKLTGEFTGYAITIATAAELKMGFNWSASGFGTDWAIPGSWTSLTLAAADRLIIEWTITIN